jgi:surface antigen
MSRRYGADADQLGRIAIELRRAAEDIDGEASTLTKTLDRISWLGDVATSYVGQWTGVQLPRIGLSTQFLRDAAADLDRNAAEQREASAGVSGVSGGAAPANPAAPATPSAPAGTPAPSGGERTVTPQRDWREVQRAYEAWATGRFAEGGVSHYQCTGWANFRWHELGYTGPAIGGNGGAMASNAGPTTLEPSLHAMASYGAGTSADYGHVMIVEEVSGDGTRIRVSEMNVGDRNYEVGRPDEYRDTRWITRGADGVFRVNGKEVRFAAFPG